MRRFFIPLLVAVAVALPFTMAQLSRSTPIAAAPASNAVPGQYIVTLKPGERPETVSARLTTQASMNVEHIYEHALNGFSAKIPDSRIDDVRADPAVLSVVEDRLVTISADTHPIGVRRSEADRNALSQIGSHTNPIDVDVAVLDTGIDSDHPDLNVVGGVNCVPGETSWEDQHGHGSHVAGTIGALDNDAGVVGVAPGARLWAVRVLNANGEGEFSDVMCGVDWVTAHADTIEVANMSLGGEGQVTGCGNGGFHQSICESVAAGVTYVVASGNSGVNASGFVPAAFPEVITVSAISDTDGAPGGNGPPSIFYGADDTLATFSNYGAVVDIAAPGVNIQSTWLNGGYNVSSGTSMASPHVAGAAAIYRYQNPSASPAATRAHILGEAWAQASPEGFSGDTDGFAEPLLNAGTIGGLEPLPPPPPPESGCSLSAESGPPGSTTTVTCAGFQAGEWVWIYWDAVGAGVRGIFVASGVGDGSANITIPDATYGEHVIYVAGSTSGIQGSAPFTVEPLLDLKTPTIASGDLVQATVKGFSANESVELRWYDDEDNYVVLKAVTTSATGRATAYASSPDRPGGLYTIMVVGADSGATVSGELEVVASLNLSPGVGKVGATVTATVTGFQAGEAAEVRWDGETIGNLTANSLGTASLQFVVPEGPAGSVIIEAIGASGSHAVDDYSIGPEVELSTTRGPVGTQVDIALTGFAAGEQIELAWYDTATSFSTLLTLDASALGSATTTIAIPEATYSSHRVEAVGQNSGEDARRSFTVLPAIVLSEVAGPHGATVTATMTGYKAHELVNIMWYEGAYTGAVIGSTTSSVLGTATFTFQIPDDTSFGEHKVESLTASNQRRTNTIFTVEGEDGPVEATCTLASESATVDTRVDIDCYGFEPGEYIYIYWDSTASSRRGLFKAANGSGSGSFTIPDTTSGVHTVYGVGTTSGIQATATLTVVSSLELSKTSGTVGETIVATARGYGAGETVNFVWHTGSSTLIVKSVTASSSGRALGVFSAPEVAGGVYTLEAAGQDGDNTTSAEFTITFGIDLSPSTGKVGASLSIQATGYAPGASISVAWDGNVIGTFTTSQTGAGTLTTVVPEAPEGTHSVSVEDENGNRAEDDFQVRPEMELSSNREPVGAEVTLELTGFPAGEQIRIDWWDTTSSYTTLGTVTASQLGSATFILTVPDAAYSYHKVQATSVTSQVQAYLNFYMLAEASLSSTEGPAGTTVTVTLTGFKANEVINVSWFTNSYTSYVIASGSTDAFGTATITFDVPDDATLGSHKVEGRGSSGLPRADTTFTVT